MKKDPGVKQIVVVAAITFLIVLAMFFVGGKTFDVFVVVVGPEMLLAAILIVVIQLFVSEILTAIRNLIAKKREDFKGGVKWYNSYFKKFKKF